MNKLVECSSNAVCIDVEAESDTWRINQKKFHYTTQVRLTQVLLTKLHEDTILLKPLHL